MNEGPGDILVASTTLLLVFVTGMSIWIAVRLGRSQEKLQRELSAVSERQTRDRQDAEEKNNKLQLLYQQRSQIVPIWQYISTIRDINPAKPITPTVIKSANALEFIALCCESGVVDEAVIMRTFRDKFMQIFESIQKCGNLPGYDAPAKTGVDILQENRAASTLYQKLRNYELDRDKPGSLR